MTSFWSAWVIILTSVSILLILWLLLSNRKVTVKNKENTTGHVYDGIEEYDNPMPSWWIKMFLITIVFGVGYLVAYPGYGNFPGILKWTSTGQWQDNVDAADAKTAELYQQYLDTAPEELANDGKAMRIGKRIFANNCALCHGANAEGGYGFPNLTDQDWLYGGSGEQIKASITAGRSGMMPAWESILDDTSLNNVSLYVQALSDQTVTADKAQLAEGKAKYQQLCVACHGADSSGNIALGAPNLADNIWLYGGDAGKIKLSIGKGRMGKMPSHESLLTEEKIHLLSAYVLHLSTP
ncbi:MAG: cytochrome-c oxidase, cbb3-type subunit III [Spongiibacteraceae bacterium]